MGERGGAKLREHELAAMVGHCFELGNADVFALGSRGSILRLGEIAGYVSMLADKEGNARADHIRIVLPPTGARRLEGVMADALEGVRRAYRRFEPDETKTASFVDAAIAKMKFDQAADFLSDSLDALLAAAVGREALIVGEASHYRSPDIAVPADGPRLSEDEWSVHLHAVMMMAEARARASNSYVILDIGRYFPARAANLELLKTAGDVGLCGESRPDDLAPEDIIAKVETAYKAAAAGDIGKAVLLIEEDKELSELRKWFLRLVVLDRAGIAPEISRILDESGQIIAALSRDELVGVARIAAGAGRDDLAQNLIEQALPNLLASNELENALEIALGTHRQPFVQLVRERLRALHPGSGLLRSVDGRAAALDGDYAEAAALLKGATDAATRELGAVFGVLAEGIASPAFAEPARLSRSLVETIPTRKADLQQEIMLSLERAGRRDDAVDMMFAGDVDWDEAWFVFARELLGRSLGSGSRAIGLDRMSKLIDLAADFLSEHPASGYARTSISDLFDADKVGIRGIVIMAINTVECAEKLPAPGTRKELATNKLDDLARLPGILAKALQCLAQKGNGIVVAGRDPISAGELGADPDAVLDGIFTMIDHHVPDPYDEVEERLVYNLVTVAISTAMSAVDRDADIPIIRGAALKLQLAGRPQLARDLAEQVLMVAGERPERRRRALAAFADVYARIGRLREALLMLRSAFVLPSDGTWRESWDEQTVLLRILRDVGMAEESIQVIARLRNVAPNMPEGGVYGARLDTLELHAQLQRQQDGGANAWTTTRLLDVAISNAKEVLAAGDEALPAAMTLRQLIDQSQAEELEVPAEALAVLGQLIDELAGPHRVLVSAIGRLPDAALVASVAGSIGAARYSDDVSYDLRLVRRMAKKLARASTESGDANGFAYAVELLGAQGVGVQSVGGEIKPARRLLDDVKTPIAEAREIARLGMPIIGLVLDHLGLMTMIVSAEGDATPMSVASDIFAPKSLPEWIQRFPHGYSDAKLASEDFRRATSALGLPDLPDKAVVVAGDLSMMPVNVITAGGDLVGLTKSIATVPSIAWLKASIAAGREGDGSAAAWIPIAAGGSYMDTLSLMAGELEDIFRATGIALHTQATTPMALANADLAIIGAHGGLVESNRYFRGLSDDRHEPADLRHLADAVRKSRLALLFVCSGGRIDQHPESGGIVSVAHHLLDQGLDAVIAPSWPIPFTMVRPWLGAFLASWNGGASVMDAYRSGNEAVATSSSSDLGRSLAMSLYGNPFIAKRR